MEFCIIWLLGLFKGLLDYQWLLYRIIRLQYSLLDYQKAINIWITTEKIQDYHPTAQRGLRGYTRIRKRIVSFVYTCSVWFLRYLVSTCMCPYAHNRLKFCWRSISQQRQVVQGLYLASGYIISSDKHPYQNFVTLTYISVWAT